MFLDAQTVVTARHSCYDSDSKSLDLLVSWIDNSVEVGCSALLSSASEYMDIAKLSLTTANERVVCMEMQPLTTSDLGRQCAFIGFDLARDLAVRSERYRCRYDTTPRLPELHIVLFGHVAAIDITPRRFKHSSRLFLSARASYANESGLSGGAVVRFDKSSGSFVLIGIHTAGEYLHHLNNSIIFSGMIAGDLTEGTFDEKRKRSSSVESVESDKSVSMSDKSVNSVSTPATRQSQLSRSMRFIFQHLKCIRSS